MNIALYARVSTEGHRLPGGSQAPGQTVDPQLLELREYCSRQRWTVAREFTDVMSGTKDKRPGLDALVAEAEAGGVDLVLVVKLDRLGRSVLNVTRLIERLSAAGCGVICTTQGIDTRKDSPCGKMIVGLMAVFAEFERAIIVERTKAGLVNARAKGKVLGRPSPTLVAPEARGALITAWITGGRVGGVRALAKQLGGCSPSTAARLVRESGDAL